MTWALPPSTSKRTSPDCALSTTAATAFSALSHQAFSPTLPSRTGSSLDSISPSLQLAVMSPLMRAPRAPGLSPYDELLLGSCHFSDSGPDGFSVPSLSCINLKGETVYHFCAAYPGPGLGRCLTTRGGTNSRRGLKSNTVIAAGYRPYSSRTPALCSQPGW